MQVIETVGWVNWSPMFDHRLRAVRWALQEGLTVLRVGDDRIAIGFKAKACFKLHHSTSGTVLWWWARMDADDVLRIERFAETEG